MNLSFLRKQESVIEYEHKNNIDSRFRGNDGTGGIWLGNRC